MRRVQTSQSLGDNGNVAAVGRWDSIAAWQPQHKELSSQECDNQNAQNDYATPLEPGEHGKMQKALLHRVRQSQINACFIGTFAILGVGLALANAAPNQESAEVETLAVLLVTLLIPFTFNRAGAVNIASFILTLLPTASLVATFSQPLPSGEFALTWTYDAGMAFAGLGALVATLTFRTWVAWCLIIGGIILPLTLFISFVPHAPSLVGLDVASGIISSHWSASHQELYALYDFLFRPFLLTVLLGLVGTRLRRFLSH